MAFESLLNHISGFQPVSQEVKAALAGSFALLTIPRNEYLLREGQICRHLYFMEKGALRGYYNLEGRELTHWFAFENDFVTSFHSFITGQASLENIQLLEGGMVWAIAKEELEALLGRFPELERLVRLIYERYYIRLEERFVRTHFKAATERYQDLLRETPHIAGRVPLGYIASYLGISQETLSRIRSRL
ncbi:MAG: Crp/Fnr family transcriptional regulator [Ferruginibacter sp.]